MDDDRTFAQPLAEHLRRDGHEVVIADNALDAVQLATKQPPDAVLLELALPDSDAYTLASMLRTEVLPRSAAIIIITREGTRVDHRFDDLADLQLTKPVAVDQLPGLIRYVVRTRGISRSSPR